MSDASLLQRKRGLSGCALFSLALLMLAVMLVVTYWVWSLRCDRLLAKQLEEIRARGEPVSAAELEAFYALPEGTEDTAAFWLRAIELLETEAYTADAEPLPIVGMADEDVPPAGEPWSRLVEAEAFRDRYQSVIDLMHAASERGGAARFPTTFEKGYNAVSSRGQGMHAGTRLLELDSRIRAHRGDVAGVVRNLNTMLATGESLRYEPMLLSQLLRNGCISVPVFETSNAIAELELTDDQLEQLQIAFSEVGVKEEMRRAILGARVFGIGCFDTPFFDLEVPMEAWLRFIKQDRVAYLTTMERIQQAMALPYPEAKAELLSVSESATAMRSPRQALAKMLVPGFEEFRASFALLEARCEMAQAGIAIKRFELKNGRLPETLGELVPEFLANEPIDPFDGQPIRYVPGVDGTFYLYCSGKDGAESSGFGVSEDLGHVFSVGGEVEEEYEDDY